MWPELDTCSPMSCRSDANSSSSRSSSDSSWISRVWSNSSSASVATCRAWASAQLQRRHRLSTDSRRIARGSSDQSAGSWRPTASSTMPSRSAHSLIVMRSKLNSSIAVARNIDPAMMRSTRRVSRPSKRSRSAALVSSSTLCSARNSSRPIVSWLSDAGASSSRRAATIAARFSSVPLLPDRELGLELLDVARDRREHVGDARRGSARRSDFEIGSECTSSLLRRATPSGTLVAHMSPLESPTITSRLPPPRSKHTAGAGSSTTAARTAPKISRASSSPLMTSTTTPVSSSMRSTSSPPFSARRIALVARAWISSAPAASASSRKRRTVATAWSAAVGGIDPYALHDVAEAQHLLLLHDRVDVAVGLGVGDEEVEGVGAEVHRCDAHRFRLRPVTGGTGYRRRRARRDAGDVIRHADFRAMGTDVSVLALGRRCRATTTSVRRRCAAAGDRGARGEVEPLPADERAVPAQRRRRRAGGRVAGDVRPRRRGPSTRGGPPGIATTRRSCPRCWRPGTTAPSTSSSATLAAPRGDAAALRPGAPGIVLDPIVHAVRLPAGVALDLGGIGKGYAADLVARRPAARPAPAGRAREPRRRPARDGGVARAARLGDRGRRPARDRRAPACSRLRRARWPRAPGCAARGAVPADRCTTSSTRAPGCPAVIGVASVTVIAGDAWRAEVLAKAAFLAGPVDGARLVTDAGATGLIVTDDGAVLELDGLDSLPRVIAVPSWQRHRRSTHG